MHSYTQEFSMLSRVAESIYWMSRYVERAENLARFIDVTLNVILDLPNRSEQWEPLVRTTGDEEYFAENYDGFTSANVRQFLTFDREYDSSIIASVSYARENARTVREAISSEAWEQLNDFYLFVRDAAARGTADSDFYTEVKRHCHLFTGILDATMTRGKGWHFANLGRQLERADKTSRILDVKYFTLLPTLSDVGTTIDDLLWSAVLRSVSGFEVFRKKYHSLTLHRVVEFLMLDRHFPRSVLACMQQAVASLNEIGGPVERSQNLAIQRAEELISRLSGLDSDAIIDRGMHEFIDGLQTDLNAIGKAIYDVYIVLQTHDQMASSQSQSQSQASLPAG